MLNYDRYNELNATIKALQKELDTLKTEIKAELKKGDCIVIDDKIVFSDGVGKLTIAGTKKLNTAAAWELINTQENPDKYINYSTQENLTVKH